MICGTNLTATIQPHQSSRGELFGATVAENALIEATLEADLDLHWDFWAGDLQCSLTGMQSTRPHADLRGLQGRFGNRVTARSFSTFSRVAREEPYVFVTSLPRVAQFSEFRRQHRSIAVPVCGLLHSALLPQFLPQFMWLAMSLGEADVLVATSRAGRKALCELLDCGLKRLSEWCGKRQRMRQDAIVEIPLGVNLPPETVQDRNRARDLLRIPQDCFTVLYLGRITEIFKADLDTLLHSVARISAERKIRLIIAGQQQDSSYGQHLSRRLERLRLQDSTVLLENFSELLKSTIYVASDVLVSPADSVQETFGISILEAMAHARPVIASSWSGYRDLVEDGVTGFLIGTRWSRESSRKANLLSPFCDTHELAYYLAQRTVLDAGQLTQRLAQLADHPELARRMGEAGQRQVGERFSWRAVSRRFLDLWRDQIGRSKAQRSRPAPDFGRLFGHYADSFVSPNDFLVATQPIDGVEGDLSSHWRFADGLQSQRVGEILRLCRTEPVRVRDLRRRGYSMDCIMWLAKKGLCRIQ